MPHGKSNHFAECILRGCCIVQVGNYTLDADYWGRPEDYDLDRPYYTCGNDKGASDLAGTMASALAATALVWKSSDTDYYNTCMTAAKSLYDYATNVLGFYHSSVSNYICIACNKSHVAFGMCCCYLNLLRSRHLISHWGSLERMSPCCQSPEA